MLLMVSISLHISVTMPSIEVGTVGGGTHLSAQKISVVYVVHLEYLLLAIIQDD
jgi:hydroxymethylglutaryl-CoA reductase